MARGVRAGRPFVQAPRRSRVWVGASLPLAQTAGGSSVFSILIAEAELETQGKPTVARIRGQLHAQMDRSAEVSEDKALIPENQQVVKLILPPLISNLPRLAHKLAALTD